jgi:predicted GNAT family acetyltransferase/ribosome-associated protein YbcJ (S4-like RNA binding protein)
MTSIVHLPESQRWEARDEQASAVGYLSYQLVDGVLDLQHTVVDPAASGRGLGGRLVEEALQHARAEGLQVRPTCPFVPAYLEKHPEHQDLVEGYADTGSVQEVPIRDASIRLGQLLKLAGLVPDGAMARMVIENGEVTLDGEPSLRRGTQVRPGQVASYAGESVTPVPESTGGG